LDEKVEKTGVLYSSVTAYAISVMLTAAEQVARKVYITRADCGVIVTLLLTSVFWRTLYREFELLCRMLFFVLHTLQVRTLL
jgi:chromate transport protein ChrA